MNVKMIFNPLLGALFGMSVLATSPAVHAELIGTDQLAHPEQGQDKAAVSSFIARSDVQKKLQEMGLSAIVTAQRVALLSDDEARELSQKIDALPAGGSFSNNELIIILLAVVLLVLIL